MMPPRVVPTGVGRDSCHRSHDVTANEHDDDFAHELNWCDACRLYHADDADCIRPLGGTRVL